MSGIVYKKGEIVKVLDSTKMCWYIAKITGTIKSKPANSIMYKYVRLGLKIDRETAHLEKIRGMCSANVIRKVSPGEEVCVQRIS